MDRLTEPGDVSLEELKQVTETFGPEPHILSLRDSLSHLSESTFDVSKHQDYISENSCLGTDSIALLSYINDHIIGKDSNFVGPFGEKRVVYCDWTASGRSLTFVEDYIRQEVIPLYGNTHTMTSITSLQTTVFRHEARDILRSSLKASDDDAVIFVGSGCTGAIHKLIHNLSLDNPPRESQNATNMNCKLIVCLAAASNVTGILVDVTAFTCLVHRYGGLVFWDYATAAPYVDIEMNPDIPGPNKAYAYKDAIFFSMHKFVGGPQTPGILCAKRNLFKAGERQPTDCGGGTVVFVGRDKHFYTPDVEEREEGGTPAIVESIRAGIVMQLKENVSTQVIKEREEALVRQIWSKLDSCPNLIVLGGRSAPRLPIVSVLIRHPTAVPVANCTSQQHPCLFLHYNFVAALLNDLFGIQCRGGCACAGPYTLDLLGIDQKLSDDFERALTGPGFTRISLPYFMPDNEIDFVLDAVSFVAKYGWAFLPLYNYQVASGEWRHHEAVPSCQDRKQLGCIRYSAEGVAWISPCSSPLNLPPLDYQEVMQSADRQLCASIAKVKQCVDKNWLNETACLDSEVKKLRWFLLPSEAAAEIRNELNRLAHSPPTAPFHPGSLARCFWPDLEHGRVMSSPTPPPPFKLDQLPPVSNDPVVTRKRFVDVTVAVAKDAGKPGASNKLSHSRIASSSPSPSRYKYYPRRSTSEKRVPSWSHVSSETGAYLIEGVAERLRELNQEERHGRTMTFDESQK